MRVEEFLRESAQRAPDKVALIAQGTRHTYRELDRRSDSLASALISAGVQRGDLVAIFLDNSVEAAIGLFAALKTGAVFLIINATTKSDSLAFILNDCRAVGLISHARLESVIVGMTAATPSLRWTSLVGGGKESPLAGARGLEWNEVTRPDGPALAPSPPASSNDADLAMIIYTSGSTGFPKGVMMAHSNVVNVSASIIQYLENSSSDIILSVLPLSFGYGLYQLLVTIRSGGTLVLERTFAYPARIMEMLAQEQVTGFPIIPTMAALMLQMKGLKPGQFPRLRYITNAAAALPPAHIRAIRDLFPSTKLYSMYGQTECTRVCYLPPHLLEKKPGSVGIAIPNTEVYIVNESSERVGPGVVGELVVRGPHVMRGYWERDEETARALRPGPLPGERVLHTGDLFTMDAEGCLYFVSRKDDIIKTRGEKVSPKEVETVIASLPGVAEAAVVGMPDPVLGEAVKAIVVVRAGAKVSAQDVLRHCAGRLETFMIPKLVEFRESLPHTPNGKVNKRELRLQAAGEVPS